MTETKRAWCAILAKLVAPMEPERATRAFVGMLPMLPEDDRLYTAESARAVATIERKTAVPAFADIERAFGAMWKDSLPVEERMGKPHQIGDAVERLSGPKIVPKTDAEIAYVEQRRALISAELRTIAREKAGTSTPPRPSHGSPRDLVIHHCQTEGGLAAIRSIPALAETARAMAAESGYEDIGEFCRALAAAIRDERRPFAGAAARTAA